MVESGERHMVGTGEVVLARYVVRRPVGRGGVGCVYLAEHARTGQRVALKVLGDATRGDEASSTRLFLEARSIARIRSEHVVTLHDYDIDPKLGPVLVLEYLDGESLQSLVRRERFSLRRARDRGDEMLDALVAVHESGVTHRDLKPGNLFIEKLRGGSERCKVLDFGIARATDGSHIDLTRTGEVIGTPAYMSPEQRRSASDLLDQRSDLYSAGVCLYVMLTGQRPIAGADPLSPRSAQSDSPRTLADVSGRWYPVVLERFFAKALSVDRAQRFQSASAMRLAWRAACDAALSEGAAEAPADTTETSSLPEDTVSDADAQQAMDRTVTATAEGLDDRGPRRMGRSVLALFALTVVLSVGFNAARTRRSLTDTPSRAASSMTIAAVPRPIAPHGLAASSTTPPSTVASAPVALGVPVAPVVQPAPRTEVPPEAPRSPSSPASNVDATLRDARRLADTGEFVRARALLHTAASAAPRNVEVLDLLGFVEVDSAHPADALPIFQRALAIDAHDADAHFGLAEAHDDAGRNAAAIEEYERYLAMRPHGSFAPRARRALAQLRLTSPAAGAATISNRATAPVNTVER